MKLKITCPEDEMIEYTADVVVVALQDGYTSGHQDFEHYWELESEK